MRSREQVYRVLSLLDAGLNDCEISRSTDIPRSTVRDWRHGRSRVQPDEEAQASCPSCDQQPHDWTDLPERAYCYLLGLYLGDGCISSQHRDVYRLRITLDSKYPGIVRECAEAMSEVMPSNRVGILTRPDNAVEVGSSSRAWPCFFPQHGRHKKHLRRIELAKWQQGIAARWPKPLLRGLIHSDGCRSANTIRHPKKTYVYPRYLFANRSADIRRIFCDTCDQLGIAWRAMGPEQISVARAIPVAFMDGFIGPKT